jgi:hypothetical protein
VNTPAKLTVARPETAAPGPLPADLADFLDQLPVDDPDLFWQIARGFEWCHRTGYADGHARGYRDRDREFTAQARQDRSSVDTVGIRAVTQ